MRVVYGIESPELKKSKSVAAIGMFDGVHRGHQAVIKKAIADAGQAKARSVVVTFDRHPAEVIKPGSHPPILTSITLKERLISALKVDMLFILEFDDSLAQMSPDAFMDMICSKVGIIEVVVGDNFRYGADASGDLSHLREYGNRKRIKVVGMPLLKIGKAIVSSTRIRSLLRQGDLERVTELLGRYPLLTGKVIRGHGRGGILGYHTANIETREKAMMPKEGVYAGYIWLGKKRFPGAINIGRNPTFGNERRQLEVYILDFDGDIYGTEVILEFRAYIRDEITFDRPEDLARQIAKDVRKIRKTLA